MIFVPSTLLGSEDKEMWHALLGGHLILFSRGEILPLMVTADQLFALFGAMVHLTYPQKETKGFSPDSNQETIKIAAKMLKQLDKNRYKGLLMELDRMTQATMEEVKEGFMVTSDRAAYLLTGSFRPFVQHLEKVKDGEKRRDTLTRFIFSTHHFKLRESAIFVSMSS